jgi:dTDP-L-rhamnose 4-epimerase
MSSVLITGGAGFIGSHTAGLLIAQGHRVRVLDCLDPQIHGRNAGFPSYLHPDVERVRGDVRSFDDVSRALRGIDVVYHLAARTGVGQSMYDMRDYVDTNCTGTANLLEAIVKGKHPLRRLVLASSRAVYGEGTYGCTEHGRTHPPQRRREDLDAGRFEVYCPACGAEMYPLPTEEDRPLRPMSVYAWTKRAQEEQCAYAASTFAIPVTILRYFNVYGSRQSLTNPYTGVVSIFYSRMRAGEDISLYEHGGPIRDFVHVSDVARANVLAMDADVEPGTRINVGSGEDSSIEAVAWALAAVCGADVPILPTDQFRVGDIYACYADIRRAADLLGYRPNASLPPGMEEFVRWADGEDSKDLYDKTVAELAEYGLFGGARRAS